MTDQRTKIEPGMVISLGYGVGSWISEDRKIVLRSEGDRELVLTKDILSTYGELIVKGLNSYRLNLGAYADDPRNAKAIEIEKKMKESAINDDIDKPLVNDNTKDEIDSILKGKVGMIKEYIESLIEVKDANSLSYMHNREESGKNRKSVLNSIEVAIKLLIKDKPITFIGEV